MHNFPGNIRISLWAGLLCLQLALVASSVSASEAPRIGLALSGGGAKGFAHIGALKVLEEAGLRVDFVVGTSMGGVIGGLYALGYSVAELEKLALETDWVGMFSDHVSRRDLSMVQKRLDGRYVAELPIKNKRVEFPSGLVAGQNVARLLSRLTLSAHNINDFRSLPIPFACVATDIVTGKAVLLDSGFLPEAMRASMALPSIFTPVKLQGHLLLDGGLVRNFPVQDVIELGADLVVGIDVSEPLYDEGELISFLDIIDQALSFTSASSTVEQRKLCDVLISPDIDGLSTLGFGNIQDIIARGERAARAVLPQILALVELGQQRPEGRVPKLQTAPFDSIYIESIRIDGLERSTQKVIETEFGFSVPAWATLSDIERATDRVYSSLLFDRAIYKLEELDGRIELVITVVERSEDLFRFALRYNSQTEASVLLGAVFRNVTKNNSFLNMDLELGQEVQFDVSYLQHIGWRPRVGLIARLNYNDSFLDLFEAGQRQAQLNITSLAAEVLFGSVLSTKLSLAAGIRTETVVGETKIAASDTLVFRRSLATLVNTLRIDTFDRSDFPTRGIALTARNDVAFKGVGSRAGFSRHLADLRVVIPVHSKLSLLAESMVGYTRGDDVPLNYSFVLGGMETSTLFTGVEFVRSSFLGLKHQERIGRNLQFWQAGIQIEPWNRFVFIVRANAGDTLQRWTFVANKWKWGLGLTAATLTPLGPVEITLAGGDQHDFQTYLNVGFKF